jgi:demethylmenaquinone methyltransferase/2-methoxy-6-polyprenyl-1,4-benzoquinol methylase
MFSAIAPSYDRLNRLLSFNIDQRWRRRAIGELQISRRPDGVYLDLCAGTLDVAAAIAGRTEFRGSVIAADFSEGMLRVGSGLRAVPDGSPAASTAKLRSGRVMPAVADALTLPLAAGSCAGAIVAFGIRNVANLDDALGEAYRVLEPGARFVILEFTTPRNSLVRAAYHTYFHHLLPRIGALVSGHPTAYRYLPESVSHFPPEPVLADRLRAAGFSDVGWESLTFGVAAIHRGTR